MVDFSELKNGSQVIGLVPGDVPVLVEFTKPIGDSALQIYYRSADGNLADQVLYKEDLSKLRLAEKGLAWSFDSPPEEFKLALEATRIQLGSMFDPMMAVHSSNIDPLPHQISAVYQSMLPKQPLRFVLADDPGAGKTIMAGLLIKELIMRSDARKVLIVAPGSLTEQWQDELRDKFSLEFTIFSNELQEQSGSGNYFQDADFLIARIDQIARNEDYQEKLRATQWDLIIVDEAHKMAAHRVGENVRATRRYDLGKILSSIARHFLMMTATPHSGSDADFNLWLALIDKDRFYGAVGTPKEGFKVDVSDIMRRMVKEDLLKFDGTRLFPERKAITVTYQLSQEERDLYEHVTRYVVNEMNRAKRIGGAKGNQVGFALTVLQRRLASSPEAIFQSLDRRLEKLKRRLRNLRHAKELGGADEDANFAVHEDGTFEYTEKRRVAMPEDMDDAEDELSPEEYEQLMESLLNESATESIPDLETEIETLRQLVEEARQVRRAGRDCKWTRLSELLQSEEEMRDDNGARQKLIVFTEHKDTMEYLRNKVEGLLGGEHHVRCISGSCNREARRQVQEEFCNDPEVHVLIATDAAGEGVNLQRAHLLINYDLPWNPNRLEQRFGRIHRIGQTETCLMWNMVAANTREGDVFKALFDKLETERGALGGKVFDILGEAFNGVSLKELLLEAISSDAKEQARRRMTEKVAEVLDHKALQAIMERNMLVDQAMTPEALYKVKEELDRAEARKLQPYFVQSFFKSAFESHSVGGTLLGKEPGRFQVRRVPACLAELNRQVLHTRRPLAGAYERICFEKKFINAGLGRPQASFVHPGHPLMETLTAWVLKEYGQYIKAGAVLVDPLDDTTEPSLVVAVSHTMKDTEQNSISERLQFVRIHQDGSITDAGWAPHLDLAVPRAEDRATIDRVLEEPWVHQDWEAEVMEYAINHLAMEHSREVRQRCEEQSMKIEEAVRMRLQSEIERLNKDALRYDEQLRAGAAQANAQPSNARTRARELGERLRLRCEELAAMRTPQSCTPVVKGCILVVPQGLLDRDAGKETFCADAEARKRIEEMGMRAVMDKERSFGFMVTDVSRENVGWDVTSQPPDCGNVHPDVRHIEVKGKAKGTTTVTVSRNEILSALNQGDKYILAIVLVDGDSTEGPFYIPQPFTTEPDAAQVSSNFDLQKLLDRAVKPEDTI